MTVAHLQVSYINARPAPTPGHRPFSIAAALKCAGSSEPVSLPERRGYVFVGPNKIKLLEKQLHRRLSPVK